MSEGKGDQAEHQTVDIQKVTDVCHPEGDGSLCSASMNEQCRWRLERLLGKSSEVVKMANEEDDLTMDSICTEDFLTRFRDEMLDLPGKDTQTADVPTTTSNTADLTSYHERIKNQPQHSSTTPVRHLTGIPIQSFDSVTIDTDLDTVRSEKVRQHLKSALSTKTSDAFCLSRETVFHTRPAIQNNILSFSSDDEGTVGETSGESSSSKHYSRGWRRPSGRKGRSSHQNRRNGAYTSTGRPQDKIRMDKDQLKELRLSLAKLQQQKIAAVQSLEMLREEMYQTKTEQQSLKDTVRDSRAQVQNIRCELHRLQAQRDVCLDELRVLQEQQMTLVQRQKMTPRYDINCHKCVSRSVSVLERKEMDRLLDNAKSELFSEQRRFRETLDSMQEKLDEVNQELEQKDEDFRALQQKCSNVEKQLTDAIREREQIQESSQEDLKHQVNRFEALERTVAQKELLLQGLEEEKKTLCLELCSLREQNIKLTEIQNRTKKEKEQEISQLTLQLTKRHQEEVQMVHQQADEFKSAALNEQAQAHKQTLDSLYNCIQIKDEEVKRLKDEIRRQAEELRRETQEKIENTLKREEKKWEEQKEKALKEQREILEEQMEEVVKRERVEVEKERRNTLALQNKVTELQKQAEKDMVRLKESLQCSEQELQHLRTALSERDQKHLRREARHERQMMNWAQDIHTESVCLQELLKHNGLTIESKHLCDSPTVHEALQTLQCLTKAIQQLINDLKNEINSQRRAALQLSLDKEQEFRLQKDQLTEEKERALASLKDKLIQEKMSSLVRTKLHMDDDDDTDGLFARLRRQLKAKDDELRLVQKNMAEWKNKTTARLTHKIQLELTAELDRVPKPRAEQQKRLERLENEMRHLTGQCRDYRESQLSSTDLQNGPDVQHSSKSRDLTSYKLLQHLQSRIRQLQTENQTHRFSPGKRDRDARNLGGSYLDTIAPAPESYKKEYCSPAKTMSS